MQSSRRHALRALSAIALIAAPALALSQSTSSRSVVEIAKAKTDGLRHTLLISVQSPDEELRLIAVYKQNGWRPALNSLSESREQQLALARRSVERQSAPPSSFGVQTTWWDLSFEERGLPNELYVVACRISKLHGGRSLSRELPDLRRILEMINEPTFSQREKTIEDVLRALFEFDWQPLAYTRLTPEAKRN